jgi:hypothetical protein
MVSGSDSDSNSMPNIFAIRQSANLYIYCTNNPILFSDPSGLLTEVIVYTGEGNAWYGHAEISINGVLYTYGMYGEHNSMISGDGILVKTEASKYLAELNNTRAFTVFKLDLIEKEESRIVDYYENLIKSATIYEDRSEASGYIKEMYNLTGKLSKYFVLNNNCVTVMTDAIYSSMDDPSSRMSYMWDGSVDDYVISLGAFYPPFVMDSLNRAYESGIILVTGRNSYAPGQYTNRVRRRSGRQQ